MLGMSMAFYHYSAFTAIHLRLIIRNLETSNILVLPPLDLAYCVQPSDDVAPKMVPVTVPCLRITSFLMKLMPAQVLIRRSQSGVCTLSSQGFRDLLARPYITTTQ